MPSETQTTLFASASHGVQPLRRFSYLPVAMLPLLRNTAQREASPPLSKIGLYNLHGASRSWGVSMPERSPHHSTARFFQWLSMLLLQSRPTML